MSGSVNGASNKATAELTLVVAGSPDQLTGGYLYDARIVEGLGRHGVAIEVIGLEGRFPEVDETATAALDRTLAARPDGARVIIDGLAMGALPEIIEHHAGRLSLVALVHHPLADETGLNETTREWLLAQERRALAAVQGIIVTSGFTARRLATLNIGHERIKVVPPGVAHAPLARGSACGSPLQLLCVATLIPRKGHRQLIEALAMLDNRDWRCDLVGDTTRDDTCVSDIRAAISDFELTSRITLHGALTPARLEPFWAQCDLFVLPSHYEGYGMVIDEALARGLPIITTTGGALADTLPEDAGMAVAPGDVHALSEALQLMLDDADWRQRCAEGAQRARKQLSAWDTTALEFQRAVTALLHTTSGSLG